MQVRGRIRVGSRPRDYDDKTIRKILVVFTVVSTTRRKFIEKPEVSLQASSRNPLGILIFLDIAKLRHLTLISGRVLLTISGNPGIYGLLVAMPVLLNR
jgi:hypothetical protein